MADSKTRFAVGFAFLLGCAITATVLWPKERWTVVVDHRGMPQRVNVLTGEVQRSDGWSWKARVAPAAPAATTPTAEDIWNEK